MPYILSKSELSDIKPALKINNVLKIVCLFILDSAQNTQGCLTGVNMP